MKKKKTISIIQPSFFSYNGYFEIIDKSDVFIFYDHVQYDKGGWRNRNKILINDESKWITIPVFTEESKIIKDVKIFQPTKNLNRIFKTIKQNYKDSLNYNEAIKLLERIFFFKDWIFLSEFNIFSTKLVCDYLNIKTNFYQSSQFENNLDKNLNLINLCKKFNCSNYLSGKLAKNYIKDEMFDQNNISIEWYEYKSKNILEKKNNLSIIHSLFNNSYKFKN